MLSLAAGKYTLVGNSAIVKCCRLKKSPACPGMSAIAVRWKRLSASEWAADVSNGRGIYLYSIRVDAARGDT